MVNLFTERVLIALHLEICTDVLSERSVVAPPASFTPSPSDLLS